MLLCTTALGVETLDSPAVLLGEWCLTYDRKARTDRAGHIVCPYHWDDRAKLKADYAALRETYERLLPAIGDELNRLHGIDWPRRQWEIVIGTWLRVFIAVVFDRHEMLRRAAEDHDIDAVAISADASDPAPDDANQFFEFLRGDPWNQHLMSRIARTIPQLAELRAVELSPETAGAAPTHASAVPLKARIKHLLGLANAVLIRRNAVVAYKLDVKRPVLVKLARRLRAFPAIMLPAPAVASLPARDGLREKMALPEGAAPLDRLVSELIPAYMPRTHLEHFAAIRGYVARRYPRAPKVILTTVAYYVDEYFKVWTAEQIATGTKYVIQQHGGNYGASDLNDSEELQLGTADIFASWGWTRPARAGRADIIPMPALKISALKVTRPGGIAHVKGGRITVPLSEWPRYSYRLYSVPIARQQLDYLDDIIGFADGLAADIGDRLAFRILPNQRGWFLHERLRNAGLGAALGHQGPTYVDDLAASALTVVNTNSTTIIEALAMNFPAVLLLDPEVWNLNAEARPVYDRLREAGILHDTPQSAAEWVNRHYRDPGQWWWSGKTQDAVRAFNARFSYTSDSYLDDWARFLRSVATNGVPDPAPTVRAPDRQLQTTEDTHP